MIASAIRHLDIKMFLALSYDRHVNFKTVTIEAGAGDFGCP
ncbi:MAG: hypothetical protein AAFW82_10350 [Pseudomonadota bacterium]